MGIFDLPTGANPAKDTPVGKDEMGRTIYQTGYGARYVMPDAPKTEARFPTNFAYEMTTPQERAAIAVNPPIPQPEPNILSGTGIMGTLGNFNQMFNPVEAIGQSMAASQQMLAPETAGWDRVTALGNMLSGVAGVTAPAAAAYKAAMPAATALMESLLGWSPLRQPILDRATQPGPMPTLYSNPIAGDVGRPPVTFDEVERAMREVQNAPPIMAGGPMASDVSRPPVTFAEAERAMQEAQPLPAMTAPEPAKAPPVTMATASLPPPPTTPNALPAPPQAFVRPALTEATPKISPKMIARLVTAPEVSIIARDVPVGNSASVQEQIARQKSAFLPADGWAPNSMVVTGVKTKAFKPPKKKETETDVAYAARVETARGKHEDTFEVAYKEVPYKFDKPPMGVASADWQKTMVTRQVQEIKDLADRVRAKDPAAIAIVNEANWYRSMRNSLRKEFGGMGDVFADVLGATSAQTGVEMNWNNAIEVLRRFSRGEFDKEISMYDEMLKKGNVNPTVLGKMHNDPDNPFRLITSAAGSLFNTNSPAATKALFDMFRVATGAPKTPNFTGNLIGYTNAATIDVWAARHLRRLAGLDRIPPPAESGVTGAHLKGSTLEQPNVSGEFGFGQKVMAGAADEVNKQGIISAVAPNLQDMNPDDLQAVAWFIEKERWTQNGWTSKAGEGGSFEFESSLAGAADPNLVRTLRRRVTESFKPPPMRKKDTADSYAARVAELRAAHEAGAAEAQKELDQLKAPLARYVLGISVERPGVRPTNVQQAEIAGRLGEPAKADPSVVTYQINNTYGRFMQSDERAFNAEFVVRQNFDPSGVTRRMVEVAKEADQDAAFISKVVPLRTPESRPGVEIYFRKRQDPDFARRLSDKLTQYGVDGFTFVTDSRVMDRPGAQAGLADEAVAGINGLRFQYIPEFDMGRDAWAAMSPAEKAAKIDDVEYLFTKIANDIQKTEQGISAANIMHYETNVIERDQYDGLLGTSAATPNQ